MKFQGIFQNGGFLFQDADKIKDFAKKHEAMKFELLPYLPESRKMRNFYHGAVLPLWAYFNDWDYRDSANLEFLHNEAKNEFNSEIAFLDGKKIKRGLSTKGKLQTHIENVILYLEEQYAVDRVKMLNPEHYKEFRDKIYLEGKYDDYIGYLVDLKILSKPQAFVPVWHRNDTIKK